MEDRVENSTEEQEDDYDRVSEEREADDEDDTCCHRATCCIPTIREIIVTEAVFARCGKRMTWSSLFWIATNAGMALMGWTALYCLLGETMLPTGGSFGFFALIVFSYLLGWGLTFVPYLHFPPVFGMLLAGMIVRNSELYDIRAELGTDIASKIRTFCLTFIMIRAGLELTSTALRRHPIFVLALALLPCTVEMLALSVCCRYLLSYPWAWSLMTGTIVACLSPVITVNCVLALAERGYGEDKGFASLLCTAASIDDIFIVSLFSFTYSIAFEDDEKTTFQRWWSYVPGLGDLVVGIVVGVTFGVCLVFFPHRNYKYAAAYRIVGLVLASLTCTAAGARIAISGGGYLATIILSFVAVRGWTILAPTFNTMPLRKVAFVLWHLAQPVLVGVIGADIDLSGWDSCRLGLYVLCILVGLLARCVSTLSTTFGTPFTWKERLFVAVAWLPKGTLQAALAPMALERAKSKEDPKMIDLAVDLTRISMVAVVLLAPLGACAITSAGPILLNRVSAQRRRRDRELSYLRILSLQPILTRSK